MHCSGLDVPHVIVVGASAGGLQALVSILSALPADLPAPILIVQHISPDRASKLAPILSTQSHYHVMDGADGLAITPGMAYVAPTDQHMLLDAAGRIRLQRGPRLNFSRPSIDRLFAAVAPVFGARTIAVLLTGGGKDGTEGSRVVHDHGGHVIAQSPDSSEHSSLPRSAIAHGFVDDVLPLPQIPQRLVELTAAPHA